MSWKHNWPKAREIRTGKRRLYGKRVRARSWRYFYFRYAPILREDEQYIYKPKELPEGADPRHWWTVIVYDAYTYRLHLKAGLHHPNPEGYILTKNWWGGEPEKHATYLCENRRLPIWTLDGAV